MTPGLQATIVIDHPGVRVEAELEVAPGETLAIVGPNGAGKTTLLRALAGLEPLSEGAVLLDGEVLEDPARGVRVPPERRSTGVVFQDRLLFPHLDALDNVAFGLRCRGVRRGAARARAGTWLETAGLGDRVHRRVGELSGGEAQRVALGRALVLEPRLLLLDEPLAALDAGTHVEMCRTLRALLATSSGSHVLVTHDPLDAATLASKVAVLEGGRVVQAGTFAEITARPRSRYVADLVGVNLVSGVGRGHHVRSDDGFELTTATPVDGPVLLVVHPRAVSLHLGRPEGSPRNVWQGTVDSVDRSYDDERVRVRVTGPVDCVAEVTAPALAALDVVPGARVWVSIKASEVTAFPE